MLLWLSEYLTAYASGFQVFQYLTFRGILGVMTALAISLLVGPYMACDESEACPMVTTISK